AGLPDGRRTSAVGFVALSAYGWALLAVKNRNRVLLRCAVRLRFRSRTGLENFLRNADDFLLDRRRLPFRLVVAHRLDRERQDGAVVRRRLYVLLVESFGREVLQELPSLRGRFLVVRPLGHALEKLRALFGEPFLEKLLRILLLRLKRLLVLLDRLTLHRLETFPTLPNLFALRRVFGRVLGPELVPVDCLGVFVDFGFDGFEQLAERGHRCREHFSLLVCLVQHGLR